jgi:hypothetical protein
MKDHALYELNGIGIFTESPLLKDAEQVASLLGILLIQLIGCENRSLEKIVVSWIKKQRNLRRFHS